MTTFTTRPRNLIRARSGPPRGPSAAGHGTAVVIGGGFAGMLAAWALRGVADRIVIIERDRYPSGPDPRVGVPQAWHAHLLLEAGHRALETMMPGIRDELLAAGATRVAMSGDLHWLSAAGPMAEYPARLTFFSCTRALLDHTVRERVRREPSIEVLEATDVVEVLGTAQAVTGVRIRTRGGSDRGEDLPAQLVVDASGRGSRMPEWLRALGAAPVTADVVDQGVSYLSRWFHRPAEYDLLGYRALYEQTRAPDRPFTGSLLPVEGNRIIVSLGAMRGHESATGEQGFATMLGQLRSPLLREVLAHAEPASPVRGFRPKPSVRYHYHRCAPDGLVVIGDAATSFNPVYGGGLSVAALGARALERAVADHGEIGHAAARAARRGIHAAAGPAWTISAAEDVRFPTTIGGPSNVVVKVQHRFLDRALARASTDPRVTEAFHQTMSLVASPAVLLRPAVLASILLEVG
ncbi:NAD(P)/FAD-dependent oxidoreductase [Nocardia tengchongensis]|uniref:NAD(P)/FAD-dependent oxidoreductase n=1 Tax=Nocardia tengchongensis TaxID=2055889 RepID=UPI0036AA5A19